MKKITLMLFALSLFGLLSATMTGQNLPRKVQANNSNFAGQQETPKISGSYSTQWKAGPIINYASPTASVNENTNCNYTDFNYTIQIGDAPSQTATVTFDITGSEAVLGRDFDIIPASVNFAAGSIVDQNMTVRIYHDGLVESNENINVALILNANGGDATLDPAAKSMVITIMDNDVMTVATLTTPVFTEDFEDTTGWTMIDADGDTNNWSIIPDADGYGSIVLNCGVSETNLAFLGGTGMATPDNYYISPQITIPSGITSASLSYVIASIENTGTGEHYSVYFTTNKSTPATIQSGTTIQADTITVDDGTGTQIKTHTVTALAGQTGYFVFRHKFNLSGDGIILLDTVELTTTKTTNVQTTVNTPTAYNALVPQSGMTYATDATSGNIMLSVNDTDNFNYGCTTVSVSRDATTAGAPAVNYLGTAVNEKVMAKAFTVDTTNSNPTGTATLIFYFTEAEIAAWESATGNLRTNLRVVKQGETNYSSGTLGAFGATGVSLTSSFISGASGTYYFGIDSSPVIAFNSTTATIIEDTNCNYTDVTFPITIEKAPSANADITFNVTGGTATATDYQIVNPMVTFAAGSMANQNLTVRVFHDGLVEGNETINVGLTLNANSGDATLDVSAKDIAITINDNEIVPIASIATTVFTEDFDNVSDWTKIDGDGDTINWTTTNQADGTGSIVGFCGFSYTDLSFLGGPGTPTTPNNYFISPQMTIPSGITSATLSFVIGSIENTGTGEHYAVYFTPDKSTPSTILAGTVVQPDTITGDDGSGTEIKTIDVTALAGQTGYLAFRHIYNTDGDGIILLDTVDLSTLTTTLVQTAVNTPTAYTTNVTTGTVYATDKTSKNIMLSISDTDNFDYGCTTVSVSRDQAMAGAAAVDYGANTDTNLKVMAKVFTVATTNNNSTGTANLTFYFTEAEIAAWESATGNVRTALKVFKQGDTNYTAVTLGSFDTGYPTLTATFANGASGDFYFGVASVPTDIATTIVNSTCGSANGSITLGAVTGGTAPYTYSFNGSPFTGTTSYTGLVAGSFTIIVKDADGNTYSTSATVIDNPGPTALATIIVNSSCGAANGSVTLDTVTGGVAPYTYSFDGSGFTATLSYAGLLAGSYPIIVKDTNGCTFTTSATVIDNAGPTAIGTTPVNASCGLSDGSVDLGTVTGGTAPYSYNFNSLGYSAVTTYSGLAAGSYSLDVKDANGCIFSTIVSISNTGGPTSITTTIINETCGSVNGSVSIDTVTDGATPYTYNFDSLGYSATTLYSSLAAGSYSLEVKDANGCIFSTTVSISNAAGPSSIATTVVNETCGSGNGSITIDTVTGGVAPYTYDFNGLGYSGTTLYSGLPAGCYTIDVKDTNGCIFSTLVCITNSVGPTAIVTTVVDEACGGSNGSITLGSVTDGTAPYTYALNGSPYSATTLYSSLVAGCYSLDVKDTNGCIFSTTVCITNNGGPSATDTTVVNATCGLSNGSVSLGAVTGGTAPFTYSFNASAYTVTTAYGGLAAGTYTIDVKDANGCIYNTTATVIDNPGPTAITTSSSGNTITIDSVTGGTPPYTYSFNGSAYTTTTVYTGTGSDTIDVKDANGCIFSTTVLGVSVFVNNQFSAYPNPTTGLITMALNDNASVIDTIQVIDVLGKTIQSKTIHSSSVTIDLSNLSNGLYFVKVKSEGQEKVVKVIKQ